MNLLDEVTERAAVEMKGFDVALRCDSGVAASVSEHGHFSSEATRSDVGDVLACTGDFECAVYDDNHLVGPCSFVHQRGAG